MAVGSTYPITVADDNGSTRLDGTLTFGDSTNQPAPSSNSIIAGTSHTYEAVPGAGGINTLVPAFLRITKA